MFEDGFEPKTDVYDPLKVSAVVFGHPILTEREADYVLSQSIEPWKKLAFLLTNVPYTIMAISSFFLSNVDHKAFTYAIYPLCENPNTYSFLAVCVSCSSFLLHSSQGVLGIPFSPLVTNVLVALCNLSLSHSASILVALLTHAITLVRVGHWCCSTARARTFHRRRVQDRFDVADCACAAVAVLGAVACQGVLFIGFSQSHFFGEGYA